MTLVTGAGENYLSFAGAPSTTAFTIMAWVYLRSDANNYSVLFGFSGGATHPLMSINNDGVRAELGDAFQDYVSSYTFSVGSWAHLCWRRTSTSNNELYANGSLSLTTTQDVGTGSTSLFIGRFGDTGLPTFNAGATRLYAIKIWNVALSPEEIALERFFITPKRRANLWAWLPCTRGGVIGTDWSGNGRNFTVNGTIPQEDPAPVVWGGSNLFVPNFVAPAPPTYYASPLMLSAC